MKQALLLLLTLSTTCLIAQVDTESLRNKLSGVEIKSSRIYSEHDTIPLVINPSVESLNSSVLCFLNGKIINLQALSTIDPTKIEEMTVENDSKNIDGIDYKGIIKVQTKNNYEPRLITLNELQKKYLDVPDNLPIVFLVNNKVITNDPAIYQVDEKFIMKISVHFIKQNNDLPEVTLVKLTSRTKENIAKANTIILR